VPTLADRMCRVVIATNPYGRFLAFPDLIATINNEIGYSIQFLSLFIYVVGLTVCGQLQGQHGNELREQ
jgi:hypothetical protein